MQQRGGSVDTGGGSHRDFLAEDPAPRPASALEGQCGMVSALVSCLCLGRNEKRGRAKRKSRVPPLREGIASWGQRGALPVPTAPRHHKSPHHGHCAAPPRWLKSQGGNAAPPLRRPPRPAIACARQGAARAHRPQHCTQHSGKPRLHVSASHRVLFTKPTPRAALFAALAHFVSVRGHAAVCAEAAPHARARGKL
jgi:hypothetical protein